MGFESKVSFAFLTAVASMRRTVARSLLKHDDLDGRITRLPIEASFASLEAPLTDLFVDAAEHAFKLDDGTKAAWSLATQLAHEWAQTQSASMVTRTSAHTRSAIQESVAEGIRRNSALTTVARSVEQSIGLTARDARQVGSFRRRLLAAGMDPTKAEAKVARLVDKLVRRRAMVIARTETKAAIETGKLERWRIALADGSLGASVRRRWVTRDPCPTCRMLGGLAPVAFGQPFRAGMRIYWTPPAHPNCKCRVALVGAPRGFNFHAT